MLHFVVVVDGVAFVEFWITDDDISTMSNDY